MRGFAAARVAPALSLKTISAPPLRISRNFEDHIVISASSASPLRYGVTPKRDQRPNTVATKKTNKNADRRARCEFHDHPALPEYHTTEPHDPTMRKFATAAVRRPMMVRWRSRARSVQLLSCRLAFGVRSRPGMTGQRFRPDTPRPEVAVEPYLRSSGISILQHAPSDANIRSTVPPSS